MAARRYTYYVLFVEIILEENCGRARKSPGGNGGRYLGCTRDATRASHSSLVFAMLSALRVHAMLRQLASLGKRRVSMQTCERRRAKQCSVCGRCERFESNHQYVTVQVHTALAMAYANGSGSDFLVGAAALP